VPVVGATRTAVVGCAEDTHAEMTLSGRAGVAASGARAVWKRGVPTGMRCLVARIGGARVVLVAVGVDLTAARDVVVLTDVLDARVGGAVVAVVAFGGAHAAAGNRDIVTTGRGITAVLGADLAVVALEGRSGDALTSLAMFRPVTHVVVRTS